MKSGNDLYVVFGGTGVIGKSLIKRLVSENKKVVNISRVNKNEQANKNYQLDLGTASYDDIMRLYTKIRNDFSEYVIKGTFYLATYSTSEKMSKKQLENEPNVVDNIIGLFGEPFLYMSSYAVMDDTKFKSGDVKINYRRAKTNTEKVITNFSELEVYALRVPAVYGGSDNHRAVYKIAERLKNNKDVCIHDNKILFVYLKEVVDEIMSIYSKDGLFPNSYEDFDLDNVFVLEKQELPLLNIVFNLKTVFKSSSDIIIDISDEEDAFIRTILND